MLRNCLIALILLHVMKTDGTFFAKHVGFQVPNNQIPLKIFQNITDSIRCISLCNAEVHCLTTYLDYQLKICVLYETKMSLNSLVIGIHAISFTKNG